MRLTLKVCSYCDQPVADLQERTFDSFPIIVGRSNACDYSLNDASRYISSNHAAILLEDGQLLIQDTSANGVYVNGAVEPIGRGQTMALRNESTLAIGDYTLVANIEINSHAAPLDAVEDPFALFEPDYTGQSGDSEEAAYDPFRGDEPDWTPPSSHSHNSFTDDWDMNENPVSDNWKTQKRIKTTGQTGSQIQTVQVVLIRLATQHNTTSPIR